MAWNGVRTKQNMGTSITITILQSSTRLIKEKRQEWNLLLETKGKLVEDNAHFGLKDPEFPMVDDVQADLDKHEEMWGLFEEFNRELRDMSQEEWIIFR